MTTHSNTHRPAFTSPDDYLALGVTYRHRDEDGTLREEQPLDPVVGTEVKIRVTYRCAACGRDAARVEDFNMATGQRVLRFVGRVYADTGSFGSEEGVQSGFTSFAYLIPPFGTAPQCTCPEHGPLRVTAEQVTEHVLLSMQLEAGSVRRDEAQRSTVRMKLSPG